jgi:hypothetical protein
MSNYLDAADTDDEEDKPSIISTPESVAEAKEQCILLKGISTNLPHLQS